MYIYISTIVVENGRPHITCPLFFETTEVGRLSPTTEGKDTEADEEEAPAPEVERKIFGGLSPRPTTLERSTVPVLPLLARMTDVGFLATLPF